MTKWTLESNPRGTGFYFKDIHIPTGPETASVCIQARLLTTSVVLAEEFSNVCLRVESDMAEVLGGLISLDHSGDLGHRFDVVVSPAGKHEQHDLLKAYILDVENEKLVWPLPITFSEHAIIGKASFAVTRHVDLGKIFVI